ncbi:hypothetical protein BGZ82_000362 [Podila clonocystis]|nr:hypothetical protein BGZ82_000362 [Podila clonocystis]
MTIVILDQQPVPSPSLLPTSSRAILTHLDLSGIGAARFLTCRLVAEMPHLRSEDLRLLESCQRFVSFRAIRVIHAPDMVSGPAEDLHCCAPEFRTLPEVQWAVRPWVSEDTLEEMSLGFECSSMTMRLCQAMFSQLGRCRALKRLGACWSSLVPRLDYGAEQLGALVKLLEFSWRFGLCNGARKGGGVDVGASGAQVAEKTNRGEEKVEFQGGGEEVVEWGGVPYGEGIWG